MKNEIFTTIELPCGKSCDILEPKGYHYFKVLAACTREDSGSALKHYMVQLARIDGNSLTGDELDQMSVSDVSAIAEAVGVALGDAPTKFFT